ncbi:hypothetical protein HMPREF9176_0551 [Streptococcus downei F0415]|uniref:Uncharacterized protein n=1 Tax=Streptococcus sobrinus W1703 TaxID=1227275 RepID=U2JD32_9STRE|nr:hypothetical protein HMPREF9176_0551 [Streptococcus downei F0415]ERJ77690.1 hypothetical protein HMPREF1557_00655 [Streptococcus sobrinus W1703]
MFAFFSHVILSPCVMWSYRLSSSTPSPASDECGCLRIPISQ